jgi:transposase
MGDSTERRRSAESWRHGFHFTMRSVRSRSAPSSSWEGSTVEATSSGFVWVHERYVGTLLKKLGFSHISARPRHPAQDERIVEAFKNV